MPRRRLDELVYLRKREVVFMARFIEVSEVDAYYLFVVLLLYKDWISEPVRGKMSFE